MFYYMANDEIEVFFATFYIKIDTEIFLYRKNRMELQLFIRKRNKNEKFSNNKKGIKSKKIKQKSNT